MGLLNEERLAEQAGAPRPGLFGGIARDWIDALPGAAVRIRTAAPDRLPAALHELRSGAVAVGLTDLPAALARVEQAAQAGRPPDAAGLERLLALAARSADALGAWWDAAL
jgi:hypothetical protein